MSITQKRVRSSVSPAEKGELAETLKQVAKRYGDGSVRMASSIPQPDRISTGVFALDLATLGGIPHNRVSLLVGERHAGKSTLAAKIIANCQTMFPDQTPVLLDIEGCVAWDTQIVDPITGRVYTAEDLYYSKEAIHVTARTEDNRLEPAKVVAWFDNGVKEVYEIVAGSTRIKVTGNHRLLVVDTEDNFSWIRADELQPGMYVCRPRMVDHVWVKHSMCTAYEAEIVGMLIGDGSYGPSKTSVVFTKKDAEVVDRLRTLLSYVSEGEVELVQFSDRHFRLSNPKRNDGNAILYLLGRLGIRGQKGSGKIIPENLFNSEQENVMAVLTGLYNTDGCVSSSRPTISYTSTSHELVQQIQELWLRFGVVSTLHRYSDDNTNHSDWYTLSINGRCMLKEASNVLGLVGRRKELLDSWLQGWDNSSSLGRQPAHKYMPSYYRMNARDRATVRHTGLCDNNTGMYYVLVDSVELIGETQTYDFTVDRWHNYVANGLVVHNTFDSVWAGKLGVDIDRLPVIPCETGEMAVDVGDALVHSEETSLLVVDSLAALTPMKEIESSAEDAHVAVQARLLGNFIRRITSGLIRERKRGHKVTVLFVNQFRTRIGVTHGDPRTIPGGKALEFCTSLQMIIKNKENKVTDSRGVEAMGDNEHSVTITKNKLNGGPRNIEFSLVRTPRDGLEEGSVDEGSVLLSFAKKFGIYTGGGTKWVLSFDDYSYTFGRSKDAIEAIQDDPALAWDLRSYLIRQQATYLGMPAKFIETIG